MEFRGYIKFEDVYGNRDTIKDDALLLMRDHWGIVIKNYKRYRDYIPFDDYLQEVYLSARESVETSRNKTDLPLNILFSNNIKWQICGMLKQTGQAVRLPSYVYGQLKLINSIQTMFVGMNGREPSIEEIADFSGLSIDRIKLLSTYLRNPIVSYDVDYTDSEGTETALINNIPADIDIEEDVTNRLYREQARGYIKDSFVRNNISDREQSIILQYYDEGCSLEQIGQMFGISRQRVDAIQKKVLRTLRNDTKLMDSLDVGGLDYQTNIRQTVWTSNTERLAMKQFEKYQAQKRKLERQEIQKIYRDRK